MGEYCYWSVRLVNLVFIVIVLTLFVCLILSYDFWRFHVGVLCMLIEMVCIGDIGIC